ncbi:MAG: hypothetical protein R3B96_02140 [Pirellulaceae bacterium]
MQLGNTNEGLSAFQESLSVRRLITELDPANAQAQRDLAIVLHKIGEFHLLQRDLAAAKTRGKNV